MVEERIGRRRYLAAVTGATGAGTAGCAGLLDDSGPDGTDSTPTETPTPAPFDTAALWPMLGGGPRHRGLADDAIPDSEPTERWRLDADEVAHTQVVAGDGRAVLATDGGVDVVGVVGRARDWSADLGTVETPALVDGTLFAGGRTTSGLVAFDLGTGDRQWEAGLSGPTSTPPTVADERVYVGTGDRLHAVTAADGQKLWSRRSLGSFEGAPAVDDGRVYAHDGTELYAFDAASGDLLWELEAANWTTTPVVAGDRVLVGSSSSASNAEVVAVSAVEGQVDWRADVGPRLHASPAYSEGTVFVGDADGGAGTLRALAASNGRTLWTRDVGPVRGQPVVDGESVVVASAATDGPTVHAVSKLGEQRWTRSPGPVRGSPTVVDGHVFVPATRDGGTRLVALH